MRSQFSDFKFDVDFHERKGFYAHAHCEFCSSSFGSGEYKKRKIDAVESSIDELLIHLNYCDIRKEILRNFPGYKNVRFCHCIILSINAFDICTFQAIR